MLEVLFNSSNAIHISNLILLIAFGFKDIFKLRIFAFLACLIVIPYYFFLEIPLYSAIAWTLVYATIHLFHILRILLERRPIVLSERDEAMYQMVFRGISRRAYFRLAMAATWRTWAPGEVLVSAGAPIQDLMVISSGRVQAFYNGKSIGEVSKGQLLGTTWIILEEDSIVDFVAAEETQVICWPITLTTPYLAKHPDIVAAYKSLVNQDLVNKIKTLITSSGSARIPAQQPRDKSTEALRQPITLAKPLV